MESDKSASKRGPLTLILLLAGLLGLAVVVVSFWTTRSDAVQPAGTRPASSSRAVSAREPFKLSPTRRPRPVVQLISTAVAENPSSSRATVFVEAREETVVLRPGDVVATDADADLGHSSDGGVASAGAHTILYSIDPGRAELQRGDEYWTVELTDEAPSRQANAGQLVAILGDSNLSPAEKVEELLAAKRGLPVRENFMSEASFAPRFDERGEMNGLYVQSVVYDGVYAQMGLAGGDVLFAVDGIALDSPDASDIALTAFESSSSLRITRERAGTVENIVVQRATEPKGRE